MIFLSERARVPRGIRDQSEAPSVSSESVPQSGLSLLLSVLPAHKRLVFRLSGPLSFLCAVAVGGFISIKNFIGLPFLEHSKASARDAPSHREEGRTFTSFLHVTYIRTLYIYIGRSSGVWTSARDEVVGHMRSNRIIPVVRMRSGDVSRPACAVIGVFHFIIQVAPPRSRCDSDILRKIIHGDLQILIDRQGIIGIVKGGPSALWVWRSFRSL